MPAGLLAFLAAIAAAPAPAESNGDDRSDACSCRASDLSSNSRQPTSRQPQQPPGRVNKAMFVGHSNCSSMSGELTTEDEDEGEMATDEEVIEERDNEVEVEDNNFASELFVR